MRGERCFRGPETAGSDETYTTPSATNGQHLGALGTNDLSPFTSRLRGLQCLLLLLLCFWVLSPSAHAAGATSSAGVYPVDPASYHDDDVTFIPAKLWGRVERDPLNLIATVIFALAVTHTFLASQFQKRSRSFEHRSLRLEEEAADPNVIVPQEKRDHLIFWAQFYHFMGEIEAVFGVWLIPLFVAIILFKGWDAMVHYVWHVNVADAVFVVVIMAISGPGPVPSRGDTYRNRRVSVYVALRRRIFARRICHDYPGGTSPESVE